MAIESGIINHEEELMNKDKMMKKQFTKRLLLVANCAVLSIGNVGGPLISRLYFIHGGKRVWLSCWLETGGWPIVLIPLLASYLYRVKQTSGKPKLFFITPFLFAAGAVLGTLTGLDDFLYANGVARLPASTSLLIISTQLGFTALFAFILVKQKFTPYVINAIVLLTTASVVLAVRGGSDRLKGETQEAYYIGFFMTLGASVLYGFVLPMVELTYKKSKTKMSYTLVLEVQLIISMFATAFCTIGMIVNKDFQAIPREAKTFALGEQKYYTVLVFSAILWQFFFLGAVGVVFCASSLLSGILIAVLLPLTECLAVVFYHEEFNADKGIALALSIWGFVSYFYGEFRETKKVEKSMELESNITSAASQNEQP